MLTAYNKELNKNMDIEELKNIEYYNWFCPTCCEKLSTVRGHKRTINNSITNVIRHFRHTTDNNCEGMTPEHQFMESYFLTQFKEHKDIRIIQKEKRNKNQQPDIYLELKTGEKIAIEVQHSTITKEKLLKRTLDYSKKGIYVIWITDKNKDYTIDGKEKSMLSLFDKIYYLDISKQDFNKNNFNVKFYFIDDYNEKTEIKNFNFNLSEINNKHGCMKYADFNDYKIEIKNRIRIEELRKIEDENIYEDFGKALRKKRIEKFKERRRTT